MQRKYREILETFVHQLNTMNVDRNALLVIRRMQKSTQILSLCGLNYYEKDELRSSTEETSILLDIYYEPMNWIWCIARIERCARIYGQAFVGNFWTEF